MQLERVKRALFCESSLVRERELHLYRLTYTSILSSLELPELDFWDPGLSFGTLSRRP